MASLSCTFSCLLFYELIQQSPDYVLRACSVQCTLFDACLCGAGLSSHCSHFSPLRLCAHSGLARGPWVLLFTFPLSEGVLALLQSEFFRLAACLCAFFLGTILFLLTIRCNATSCRCFSLSHLDYRSCHQITCCVFLSLQAFLAACLCGAGLLGHCSHFSLLSCVPTQAWRGARWPCSSCSSV